MRVTAEVKARTRSQLLEAGNGLFTAQGFEATSTRQIAEAAGVATGTLFNYFPTKEALALEIVGAELAAAVVAMRRRRSEYATPAEALFDLVARQLRRLDHCRDVVAGALARLLERDLVDAPDVEAAVVLLRDGGGSEDEATSEHLFRAVHAGVLAFWIRDASPGYEDTLALLDRLTASIVDPASALPTGEWP